MSRGSSMSTSSSTKIAKTGHRVAGAGGEEHVADLAVVARGRLDERSSWPAVGGIGHVVDVCPLAARSGRQDGGGRTRQHLVVGEAGRSSGGGRCRAARMRSPVTWSP